MLPMRVDVLTVQADEASLTGEIQPAQVDSFAVRFGLVAFMIG